MAARYRCISGTRGRLWRRVDRRCRLDRYITAQLLDVAEGIALPTREIVADDDVSELRDLLARLAFGYASKVPCSTSNGRRARRPLLERIAVGERPSLASTATMVLPRRSRRR